MPTSYSGIGTIYYGADDRQADGSFVTTEWLIVFFFPIVPLRSYHVRFINSIAGRTGQTTPSLMIQDPSLTESRVTIIQGKGGRKITTRIYLIISRLPLNIKQVLKIYSITLALVAACFSIVFFGIYAIVRSSGSGSIIDRDIIVAACFTAVLIVISMLILWLGPGVWYKAE
jgi:hypothetical protein